MPVSRGPAHVRRRSTSAIESARALTRHGRRGHLGAPRFGCQRGGAMEGDGIRSASDVLVVEADPDEAGRMHRAIVAADGGLRVRVAAYLRGALRMLHEQAVGCVVTELALPDAAGADVVRE